MNLSLSLKLNDEPQDDTLDGDLIIKVEPLEDPIVVINLVNDRKDKNDAAKDPLVDLDRMINTIIVDDQTDGDESIKDPIEDSLLIDNLVFLQISKVEIAFC